MNNPIRRVAILAATMFAALLISTTIIQFFQAQELRDKPNNTRTLLASYATARGSILVGGNEIASSRPVDDQYRYQRVYPKGDLYAHVTGYYSLVYGAGAGLEKAAHDLLSGQASSLIYRRLGDLITGQNPSGATLELTINPAAQKAAEAALGERRGAAVALDPKTGAVLAMVSHPTFDPNSLAGHDRSKVTSAWERFSKAKSNPTINRAIGGNLYPPGSTFKLITAAAALESQKYGTQTQLPGPERLPLPGSSTSLPNAGGGACDNGTVTLARAVQMSCNTAFGYLGQQLGGDAIRSQAAKFGFGEQLKIPMSVTPSTIPKNSDTAQNIQIAIGQFDVRATPMQIAMVTAGIANGGELMKPYLISKTMGADLDVIEETRPQKLSTAVSKETAKKLTQMMEGVVEGGTGTKAQISGVKVAGKSGTAEHGEGRPPHAWFTAFAPANDPQVAVAVVVEDGGVAGSEGGGGKVSAPIAKKIMEAVINR
ncbi:Penicillin-binding protein A [Dermatophilus congolensis]|uniref:Penicillin-binding protein A n=1 Tax=Dermatophilus congolensis TaxID=1863 RepID=A0A239V7X9_9MICO|nr:penicillin-binding transpeptidase domain-containing protein [Dermatophilus congolensis]SNV18295.1 Penicillin-binding protein A [Dermatophilus congolensis]